ncbi:MAG TPA: hypothetical protein VFO58_11770 [Vicinamibacterales bacterium]|nr:hypothetical protein [Vicinamibacterales bacterium]
MNRRILALVLLLAASPAAAQDPDVRWDRVQGDGVHLRVLRSYNLSEGETASEPIVVLGGSARINGHAEDDVVVIGGTLRLGPKAVVDGDVVTVGGEIEKDPGAVVRGTIDEAAVRMPGIVFDPEWSGRGWTYLAVGGTVVRMFFFLVVATLLTVIAPGWIGSMSRRPAASSGLLGLAVQICFVPALLVVVIALIVSIVGIPLLAAIPFVLAALGFVWIAGFTGVAVRVGAALRGRSRSEADASVGDLLLGFMAIAAMTVGGHLLALGFGWFSPMTWPIRAAGLTIEYVAWTIGLGAAISSLFAASRATPPPVPTLSVL